MDIAVLYEDNHLIAINKKAGDLVQGDKTGDITLGDKVKSYIGEKYNKPGDVFLGTIHRLDRPVSGVVIYARTSKALERMNKQFHDRLITKTYWALVKNAPENAAGTLIHFLSKDESRNKSKAFHDERKGRLRCELHYRTLFRSDNYSLLEVLPVTGRHHQIRVQLAAIGCPIKGDLKYGAPRSNPDGSISLHARQLTFLHPVSKTPVNIIAPVPGDSLWKFFEQHAPAGGEF